MPEQSPLLELRGSVAAPDGHPEQGVPWHWGDPFAEQRTAARAVAVVDRSHREVLAVRGEERLSWLHLVISQHVTDLAENTGTEALVLDTHGRVEAHMVLAHVDRTVWLDGDAGAQVTSALPSGGRQSLLEYLEAMKFWSKVDISAEEQAVLTLLGPDADNILSTLDIKLRAEPSAVTGFTGGFARRMPWPGRSSVDLLVPRSELTEWWQRITAAGARPAGSWAFDALRVESLRPRLGVDTDDRTIPHEVNLIGSAAHVAKGCYRGQETVARVANIGRPPRRLVLLHLDSGDERLPTPGDPVLLDGRTVGRVGTVALHHELGPVALALVKRSVAVDGQLVAGPEDRATPAAIDPTSVHEDGAPQRGRAAQQALRST